MLSLRLLIQNQEEFSHGRLLRKTICLKSQEEMEPRMCIEQIGLVHFNQELFRQVALSYHHTSPSARSALPDPPTRNYALKLLCDLPNCLK